MSTTLPLKILVLALSGLTNGIVVDNATKACLVNSNDPASNLGPLRHYVSEFVPQFVDPANLKASLTSST